ncbi:MAG: hypothetical protein FWF99_00135 [Desulfovibrionaceae bacterium]|nr:hypothetical protein [Desulfovibrionaceae bacterium]
MTGKLSIGLAVALALLFGLWRWECKTTQNLEERLEYRTQERDAALAALDKTLADRKLLNAAFTWRAEAEHEINAGTEQAKASVTEARNLEPDLDNWLRSPAPDHVLRMFSAASPSGNNPAGTAAGPSAGNTGTAPDRQGQ